MRFVGETFVKIEKANIEEFTKHINNVDDKIQFMVGPEVEGKLTFVALQIHILEESTEKPLTLINILMADLIIHSNIRDQLGGA